MSKQSLLVITLLVALAAGCNPSSSDNAVVPDENARDLSIDASSDIPFAAADTNKPDAVVEAFLVALRDGNNEIAEALLTTIARRETKEHELAVQPPGSPSAQYEIGEIKHVQGGVHVNSIWSEFDESGERSVYEIVWVLRHEPIGWRVAGMATAVNPAKPPIYLDFENVPDLLQKWKQADAELAAQAEEDQTLQAAQPTTTLQR
ncbi:MAG: hypothetical protein H8E66_22535 [Planctomycetes bacterium]|nr:hypothetical protein [Planctomycetota bacterium]